MLTPYSNSKFLSKVFTDANGRQFRLTFFVTVVNGELKGRLISADPISHSIARLTGAVSKTDGIYYLPILTTQKVPSSEYIFDYVPVISPYFSLEFLINSQPTRAPSRK